MRITEKILHFILQVIYAAWILFGARMIYQFFPIYVKEGMTDFMTDWQSCLMCSVGVVILAYGVKNLFESIKQKDEK